MDIVKLYIDRSPEARLCSFVSALILCIFLTNISNGLSGITGVSTSLISIFWKLVLAVMFVFRSEIVLKRIDKHLLKLFLIALFVTVLNYAVFPKLSSYFTDTVTTFFPFCLVAYGVSYQVEDYELLKRKLTRISYVIALIVFFLLVGVFSGTLSSFNNGLYSMGFGYSCAIPTIFLLIDAVQGKRKVAIIGIIVLVVAIIAFGSRGPLIELVLFGAFFCIWYCFQKGKCIQGIFIVVAILTFALTYRDILMALDDFLQRQGLHSRTILLLTQDTTHLSGRDKLLERLIPEIIKDPIAIRGINAEWDVIGVYAHNIFVELIYQFGCIIGGFMILFIVWRIARTLTSTLRKWDDRKLLCVILMFASIPQLFVSSSLWINHVFWMWMALTSRLIQDEGQRARRSEVVRKFDGVARERYE